MHILRLNKAGQPIEWLNWQQATCLHARELICWRSGETIYRIRGGRNRISGQQSIIELPSIMACDGSQMARPRINPPLNNRTLFERDGYHCLYCGKKFPYLGLTRDHIIPISRGGKNVWMNVVAACKRCNQHKGNRLLSEISMELIALPYRPNPAEYLALVNSRRILQTQADYLSKQFSSNCRWQMPEAV